MQAFLDGELPSRDAAFVEEHLAACARCSAEVDGWRVLFEDLGQLRDVGPGEGFSERVLSGLTLGGLGAHVEAERLTAFLDGALAEPPAREVEAHLRACAACTEEADAWIGVLQRLDRLERFAPAEGFAARVMDEVQLPERFPLAARLRSAVEGLGPASRPEHVPEGLLQDFVDGTLPTRAAARVEAHVAGCGTCTTELAAWRSVGAELNTLTRPAPSEGFAERVMAEVRIQQTAAALAPVSLWWKAGAAARRLVPQTRRAWAALSGVAVTPAVITGLVAWAVFSHPTITLGSLASFMVWQAADLVSGFFSGAGAMLVQSVDAFGARSLFEALAAAPLVAVGVALGYTALCVLALRVLYRNLFANRSLYGRHAHAYFAS